MEKDSGKEALYRKYLANQCSPDELRQVLGFLGTVEADRAIIYSLIIQDLQQESRSAKGIDPKISEKMRLRILDRIQSPAGSGLSSEKLEKGGAAVRRIYWRAAAVLVGLLLVTAAGYRLLVHKSWVRHQTFYGELATIVLPDSSTVILNGNSRISYRPQWNKGPREVWIEGEAYFSVKHTADDRKFIVHSSKEMDVEVLGTEFNVYDRPDATRVVLNSGKVKLNIRKNREETAYVDMDPGELVEFHQDLAYEKRSVNAERYSSWINGKVVLENTPFREIAVLLEETYGLSVSVPDTSLYSERFSGTVPGENAEALLKALALSFNLRIKASGNNVIFNVK